MMRDRAAVPFALMLVVSLGAVVTALVHQYVFDMPPCAWCVLQRLIYLLIAVVSAFGLLGRGRWLRAALAAAIALLGASGIASAVYQHVVAAHSTSCRLSLAQRIISGALHLDTLLPSVFAVRVTCAAGAATLLGIPYEFWSLAAFALLLVMALFALRRWRAPVVA